MNPVDMKIITEKQKDFVQTLQAMAQGELFDAYAEFLAQENEKYNLTALDARQTRLKHFADSLSAAAAGILPQNARVCDIGSGAGLPRRSSQNSAERPRHDAFGHGGKKDAVFERACGKTQYNRRNKNKTLPRRAGGRRKQSLLRRGNRARRRAA